MDDRELETMFADALGEPPPATFGRSDVLAASRKAQARRRSMVTVACGCVVLALAGAGVVGWVTTTSHGNSTVAAQLSTQAGVAGQPGGVPERPPNTGGGQGFPTLSPMQGGDESGKNGPRAEGASGCDKVDRELATALAGELPAPVPAYSAQPGRVWCPAGSRAAGLPVEGGTVSVTLLSPGTGVLPVPRPPGVLEIQRPAAGGGTLLLFSVPADGSMAAPLPQDIDRIAGAVAARF